ncbi:MAG: DUF2807 domain-containing protein [Clostridia bacterium]|nr:DUF2807 domain-containing protein [Clostridia bacterium]
MRDPKNFGQFIMNKRKEAHLTQEALAEKLGISPQAVSKWENGVGYPDITLCTDIADALNIKVEELFRDVEKEPETEVEYPETYDGMKLIDANERFACYSSKVVEAIEKAEEKIRFADGSIADMKKRLATVMGEGNIRFVDFATVKRGGMQSSEIFEELPFFGNVSVVSGPVAADIEIRHHENGLAFIKAEGMKEFVDAIKYNIADDTLYVNVNINTDNVAVPVSRNGENRLCIYTPFEDGGWLSLEKKGSGECNISTVFNDTLLTILGSGDINARKTHRLTAKIFGSGDISLGGADECASIEIKGSGDLEMEYCANPDIDIMGSGDVNIDRVSGTVSIDILGSGDVNLSGEADKLICEIHGSGDLNGEELTVTDADITLIGGSDACIKRIKGTSREDISENCELTVYQRG